PTRELVVAEEVGEDRDQDPDPDHEEEDLERKQQRFAEVDVCERHGQSFREGYLNRLIVFALTAGGNPLYDSRWAKSTAATAVARLRLETPARVGMPRRASARSSSASLRPWRSVPKARIARGGSSAECRPDPSGSIAPSGRSPTASQSSSWRLSPAM